MTATAIRAVVKVATVTALAAVAWLVAFIVILEILRAHQPMPS